ncbi:MAG: hypothetical protein DLM62_10245 [Pseudonocardiales bacterium]|nr:MAG: hypothetical protein DLM62_10245 [Pseudonocardiales bacterium]
MLGAGVFATFGPAARVAGAGLLIALGIAAVVACCNGIASAQLAGLAAVGPAELARSVAPLAAVTNSGSLSWLTPVVRVGGAIASAGALLSLLAGVGRTVLAMARDHELPHVLAAVHDRYQVPHRADIILGLIITTIVLPADLRGAIGLSSFAVLTYYAITNAASFTLLDRGRWWRRPLAVLGGTCCAALALTLPLATVATGAAVASLGLLGRALRLVGRPPNLPGGRGRCLGGLPGSP